MELKDVKKPQLSRLSRMIETAKFLGISYPTLYRMVKAGKIKAVNVANTGTKPIFAFRAEDVQEYYDSLQNSDYSPKTKHK